MKGVEELCELLEKEFQDYFDAFYADQKVSDAQCKEIKQAFFSGMHVLNQNRSLPQDVTYETLKKLLLG